MSLGYWEATDDPLNRRRCPTCGAVSDGSDCFGGPDPCLGRLTGIKSACCGHGVLRNLGLSVGPIDTSHVQFDDGRVFYGKDARRVLRQFGGNPPQ